jgi:hypothetical protein
MIQSIFYRPEEAILRAQKISSPSSGRSYLSIMMGLIVGILLMISILIMILFGLSLKTSSIMMYGVAVVLGFYFAVHLVRRINYLRMPGKIFVIGSYIALIVLLLTYFYQISSL